MAPGLHAQNKASQKTAAEPVAVQLKSRPFASGSDRDNYTTQSTPASGVSHNLSNISVLPPASASTQSIQMVSEDKLDISRGNADQTHQTMDSIGKTGSEPIQCMLMEHNDFNKLNEKPNNVVSTIKNTKYTQIQNQIKAYNEIPATSENAETRINALAEINSKKKAWLDSKNRKKDLTSETDKSGARILRPEALYKHAKIQNLSDRMEQEKVNILTSSHQNLSENSYKQTIQDVKPGHPNSLMTNEQISQLQAAGKKVPPNKFITIDRIAENPTWRREFASSNIARTSAQDEKIPYITENSINASSRLINLDREATGNQGVLPKESVLDKLNHPDILDDPLVKYSTNKEGFNIQNHLQDPQANFSSGAGKRTLENLRLDMNAIHTGPARIWSDDNSNYENYKNIGMQTHSIVTPNPATNTSNPATNTSNPATNTSNPATSAKSPWKKASYR